MKRALRIHRHAPDQLRRLPLHPWLLRFNAFTHFTMKMPLP